VSRFGCDPRAAAVARGVLCDRPVTSLYNHYCKIVLSALAVSLAVASGGCATGGTQAHDARYAGVWKVRLPASNGVYGLGKAGGSGDGASAQAQAAADIDDYLKPQLARAPKAQPSREPRAPAPAPATRPQPVAVAVNEEPITPAPDAAPAIAAQPEPYAMQSAPSSGELQRYSDRDARSQKEQSFRGGDAIVISLSTVIIIGLIVLLVILLT
jgi:hypothetical protein